MGAAIVPDPPVESDKKSNEVESNWAAGTGLAIITVDETATASNKREHIFEEVLVFENGRFGILRLTAHIYIDISRHLVLALDVSRADDVLRSYWPVLGLVSRTSKKSCGAACVSA